MSMVFNGTDQYATGERSFVPGSFQVIMWHRRDADYLGKPFKASASNGNVEAAGIEVINSDSWKGTHRDGNTPNSDHELAVADWYGVLIEYEGESDPGVSADGTLTIKVKEDEAADWAETETVGGLSDITAANYVIGNEAPDGSDNFIPGTYAMLKIRDGSLLSDAQVKTELLYRNPQETMWASHAFKTGALDTDDSGNSRDLTLTGSPTFSSDEPAEILGDDPAGGTIEEIDATLAGTSSYSGDIDLYLSGGSTLAGTGTLSGAMQQAGGGALPGSGSVQRRPRGKAYGYYYGH